MKKVTSALALAALIGSPAAFAQQVEFGGDLDARYFGTRDGSTGDLATGADQRIRLQATFESEGGVQVHTRINLMNDRWTGDDGGGVQGDVDRPYSDQDHRNVELDYGYVSIPMFGGRVNVGRQVAAWGHGLTLTDDRRDRLSFVRPLGGGHTAVAIADRRYTGDFQGEPTLRPLDGNMFAGALLGPLAENIQYGFLAVYWEASSSGASNTSREEDMDPYNIRGAKLVSPYIQGQSGDFDYKVGGHYLGDSRGTAFTEDTMAGYVKTGFQLTPEFKLEGQVLHAMDGNLVDSGYDTYSSLIHNSPNNTQSATTIDGLSLSGGGTEPEDGDSRTLVAARATYEVMDWTFMGAAGWVNYNRDESVNVDEDVAFADLQVHYAVTPSTTIYGTTGYATTEDYFEATTGSMDAKDSYASSINIRTQF